MTNKFDPTNLLKDALVEAQEEVSKAQSKVDRTEEHLRAHKEKLKKREHDLVRLHNAIELIEPSTVRPAPDPRVLDKEIYDPFGYGQDPPLQDIKVGACISCGRNMVNCGCNVNIDAPLRKKY